MAITAGQDVEATAFIDKSERDATPANDAGRVPKLEADGKLHPYFPRTGEILNAGETLSGATLPVPVYQNTSDNELYACDGNDTAKLKFIGFVTSDSTDGNPIDLQANGIVEGFSGLDEGVPYYLSDTAGAITSTPGTYPVMVGVAISPTQLLIMRGRRILSGTATLTGTTTSSITTGFRPRKITIVATHNESGHGDSSYSNGHYVDGNNRCMHIWSGGGDASENTQTFSDSGKAWHLSIASSAGSITHTITGVVDTITDTGFRLNQTISDGLESADIFWVAEGDF